MHVFTTSNLYHKHYYAHSFVNIISVNTLKRFYILPSTSKKRICNCDLPLLNNVVFCTLSRLTETVMIENKSNVVSKPLNCLRIDMRTFLHIRLTKITIMLYALFNNKRNYIIEHCCHAQLNTCLPHTIQKFTKPSI